MESYFLKKFENKSDAELLYVIDHKEAYQRAAVNAAIEIYNQRNTESIPKIHQKVEVAVTKKKEGAKNSSFDLQPLLRTFSYREVLNIVSFALFYLACFVVINFYSDELDLEEISTLIYSIVGITIISLNHIVYKIEHGRFNNYIGRMCLDILLIAVFVLLSNIYHFIFYHNEFATYEDLFWVFFISIIFSSIFELLVAFARHVIRLVICQVS